MHQEGTWTKWALVPFWIIHVTFLLAFIAVYAYFIMMYSGTYGFVEASDAFFLTIFCLALVLEPLEMVFQSYQLLEPWLYLLFQVFKALFTTIYLIIIIYEYATGQENRVAIWGVAIVGAMVLSFYCSLVYGSVVMRRYRKEKRRNSEKAKKLQDDDD